MPPKCLSFLRQYHIHVNILEVKIFGYFCDNQDDLHVIFTIFMLTYSWHKNITEIMDSILYAIENFQNRLLQTNNGQFYPIFIKFAAVKKDLKIWYTVLTKVALRFPQLRAKDLIRAQASGDRGFCRLVSSA